MSENNGSLLNVDVEKAWASLDRVVEDLPSFPTSRYLEQLIDEVLRHDRSVHDPVIEVSDPFFRDPRVTHHRVSVGERNLESIPRKRERGSEEILVRELLVMDHLVVGFRDIFGRDSLLREEGIDLVP